MIGPGQFRDRDVIATRDAEQRIAMIDHVNARGRAANGDSPACRRCPASPANCKIRIGCPANILFAGLSRCLLGTCLLKTVICCV